MAREGMIMLHRVTHCQKDQGGSNSVFNAAGGETGSHGLLRSGIEVHLQADAAPDELKSLIASLPMLSPLSSRLHGLVDLDVSLAKPAMLVA